MRAASRHSECPSLQRTRKVRGRTRSETLTLSGCISVRTVIRSLQPSLTMHACTSQPCLLLLLLALYSGVCSVVGTCDAAASSDGSDSCTGSPLTPSPALSFDPYAPIVPAGVDAASAAEPKLWHMWTTPLFLARPKLRNVAAFNRAISQRALAAFEQRRIVHAKEAAAVSADSSSNRSRGDSRSSLNELFFAWQADQNALPVSRQDAAYRSLTDNTEFKTLRGMFSSYAVKFLASTGKDPEWLAARSAELDPATLFCWATVAADGSFHMSHTHPRHLISGVYYSRIPAVSSGSIVFDDPRGPRWPFDGRYIHHPTPGELILFPSWLVHQVTPTLSPEGETRVSWSCNTKGSWEDTADVNLI